MRLYGHTRSDRAEKGQGGNKFVETVYTIEHDNKEREEIGRTRVEKDNSAFTMTHETAEGVRTQTTIPIRSKKQQTQKGNIQCNNCMIICDEDDLVTIEDMRACGKCKTDEYLTDL